MPKILGEKKICKNCNIEKNINDFPKAMMCNDCISIYKKQYYISKNKIKHPNSVGRPKKIQLPLPQPPLLHPLPALQ